MKLAELKEKIRHFEMQKAKLADAEEMVEMLVLPPQPTADDSPVVVSITMITQNIKIPRTLALEIARKHVDEIKFNCCMMASELRVDLD